MNEYTKSPNLRIAGLIYAGGRGRRMGNIDKALVEREDKPQIAHMQQALEKYAEDIFITRQADQIDLSKYGHVLIDDDADQGPLAGLVRGLQEAKLRNFDAILCVAVDSISLPNDYLHRLQMVAKPHAVAISNDQWHPTLAYLDVENSDIVIEAYAQGKRALRSWIDGKNCGFAEFSEDELTNFNQ